MLPGVPVDRLCAAAAPDQSPFGRRRKTSWATLATRVPSRREDAALGQTARIVERARRSFQEQPLVAPEGPMEPDRMVETDRSPRHLRRALGLVEAFGGPRWAAVGRIREGGSMHGLLRAKILGPLEPAARAVQWLGPARRGGPSGLDEPQFEKRAPAHILGLFGGTHGRHSGELDVHGRGTLALERGRHVQYGARRLAGHHLPCDEAPAVPQAFYLEADRFFGVAEAQEVRVQRMRRMARFDRELCRT